MRLELETRVNTPAYTAHHLRQSRPRLLLFSHFFELFQADTHIPRRIPCKMDRSLDEIISERPVRRRCPTSINRTLTDSPLSNAVAVTAADVDLTDAPLPLEDLAETQAPQKASER